MPSIIPPFTSTSDRGYKFLRVFDEYFGSKGGEIGLFVEGGVAPYTWEVTGTDFTLAEAETEVQSNYVTIAADCQVDVRETVTVTDAEGSTVEIIVCTCNPYICCEDPDYDFAIDSVTGTVEAGSTLVINLTGGCPRYKWEILLTDPAGEEANYSFKRLYTNTPHNRLIISEDADETTDVAVLITDSCGTELSFVLGDETCCTEGDYEEPAFDEEESELTVDSTDSAHLEILYGCPPFTWEIIVGDTDYYSITPSVSISREATLSVSGDCNTAGPYATVRVTDACGNTDTWSVRNLDGGHWVQVEIRSRCRIDGHDSNKNCYMGESYSLDYGNVLWTLYSSYTGEGNCFDSYSPDGWGSGPWTPCAATYPPPCGGPTTCAALYSVNPCGVGCYSNRIFQNYRYYVWQCA
jgi:hypothetical protein